MSKKYHTLHGTTVEISGKYDGIVEIDFDWVEEAGACCDCRDPYVSDETLSWFCDVCDGGTALLYPSS